MRIVLRATFLQGGAGRIITDLALDQHRAGHDVRVVTSGSGVPGYGNYQAYLDELSTGGVPVRLVDSMFERRHAPNLAVVRAVDEWYAHGAEPHVIHAHAAVPSFVALLFAGARRVPMAVIQTMHGWGLVKTGDQVASDVAVLNLVDRVVVPSAHAAGMLASLGVAASRISLVPYGVRADIGEPDERDIDTMQEMGRARRQGALVVACVGTIGARKNQALLVAALERMRETPVYAVFVGDGEDRDLRAAIDAADVADRVRVHGYSRAARRIATAADVLVLPSRSEGQPIAVLEAFCDGTLVVVSDIPELAELVADGATGFQFRGESADALAEVLEAVASLPPSTRRVIRERARARYATQFTIPVMAAAYQSIYGALVNRPGSDGRTKISAA